ERTELEGLLKNKYGDTVTFDKKYGQKPQPKIDFNNPFALFKVFGELMAGAKETSDKPAIGIVYVDGMIMLGTREPSPFASGGALSNEIRKALEQAAKDDNIKAVVLRIDSPGGSATASQVILDASKKLAAKKPLVVSMGNVAGSGGYFVALASDAIYADASTITASIGVVSGKLATTPMWNKLGITFKEYGRGANADLLASSHPFTDPQRELMMTFMNDVYGIFKQHVVDNRKDKLKKPIEELAEGRVFTGKQALDL